MPRPSYPSDRKPRSRQAPGRVARTIALSQEHAARLAALAAEAGTTQAAVVEMGIDALAEDRPWAQPVFGETFLARVSVDPATMAAARVTKGTRKKGAKP